MKRMSILTLRASIQPSFANSSRNAAITDWRLDAVGATFLIAKHGDRVVLAVDQRAI
jgi:hypothetical protein